MLAMAGIDHDRFLRCPLDRLTYRVVFQRALAGQPTNVTTLGAGSRPLPVAGAPGAAKVSGRSLHSYLLVPRPKDLVKALIVPLTFAVGVAGPGGVSTTVLWHAALVWVVLELLVYQARY